MAEWKRLTDHFEQHQRTGEVRRVGDQPPKPPARPDYDGIPELPPLVTGEGMPCALVTGRGVLDRESEIRAMTERHAAQDRPDPRPGKVRNSAVSLVRVDPVTGLDVGEPLKSYGLAAQWAGVSPTTLADAVKNGWVTAGYRWRRADRPLASRREKDMAGRGRPRVPVVLVDRRTKRAVATYQCVDEALRAVVSGYAAMSPSERGSRRQYMRKASANGTAAYGYLVRRVRPDDQTRRSA